MKANLEEEGTAGRLRVYEVSQHKIYRELPRDYPVISLNDYTSLYAERVPEEEANADESSFVRVFHFHTEVNRAHGVPFKFLMKEVCYSQNHVHCMDQDTKHHTGRAVFRDEEAPGEEDRSQGQEFREDQVCSGQAGPLLEATVPQ